MSFVFKAALVAAVAVLAGCADPNGLGRGPDGLKAPSFGRTLSRDYLQIVDISRQAISVDANGRTVRAPAPKGYCIPNEGVLSGRAAVFFLMESCDGSSQPLISVSIGKAPLFDEGGPTPARLAALKSFLMTEEGRRNLGFDAGSGAIFLERSTIANGALYAIVRDGSGAGPSFADPILAKAFTELNGRMAVVTLLAPKGRVAGAEDMEGVLAQITSSLQAANAASGAQS